jgi:AcrR family transcriptional regulator
LPKPPVDTVERRGRPRRFDHDTERAMLLKAAMQVLAGRGYHEMSVAEVLTESGLSTRSFYRHFDTKEALLAALLHREVDLVAAYLERAVERAGEPRAAVDAWIDGFLDTFFDRRRIARSGAFTAPAALSAWPYHQEYDAIRAQLCGPLAAALRAGHDIGALASPDPDADARSIFGLVTNVHGAKLRRVTARAQVRRFVWPALGVAEP